jgi:hypothetical protein
MSELRKPHQQSDANGSVKCTALPRDPRIAVADASIDVTLEVLNLTLAASLHGKGAPVVALEALELAEARIRAALAEMELVRKLSPSY